jgi:glycosyltransferase involved in cell wall biosynthesis
MPYRITEIEVTEPLPSVAIPEGDTGIAILLRRNDRPIAFLMGAFPGKSVLSPENLQRIIRKGVTSRLLEEDPAEEDDSSAPSARFPSLTVAICTKDHPLDLARCLERLMALRDGGDGGEFEILVVDNSPSDGQTRELVHSLPVVKYVMEPKPGLNFARNRALKESTGQMIAFIDDDVTVDRHWLDGLRRAIAQHPDAAAFTGLVLPSELATEAQILFERGGGFEKSFETIRYGQTLPGNPFYPCVGGKLGTGCNMAFLRKVPLELGGFDEALDTGPPLPGGGDSDMLYRIIRAGYPLIYEPRFMVFHRHRREYVQLRRQYCRSWGQGLMAFVVKTYHSDVTQRPKLRRFILWWFAYKLHTLSKSLRGKHVLPPGLHLAELWGGIMGLFGAYPRSVRRAERIRKRHFGTAEHSAG